MGGEGECTSIPKGTPRKYNRTPVRIFGHILLYYRARWEFKLKSLDIECCVFNFCYRIRQFFVKFILKVLVVINWKKKNLKLNNRIIY